MIAKRFSSTFVSLHYNIFKTEKAEKTEKL